MNKRQENLRTTFGAVIGVLDNHALVVNGLPALEDGSSRFRTRVGDVDAKDKALATLGIDKAKVKEAAKKELKAMMGEMASNLLSFAATTGRIELLGQTKAVIKEMRQARDTSVNTLAATLIGLLNGVLTHLTDYQVTAAKVAALQSKATAYESSMTTKEGTFAARKTARAELNALVNSADRLLIDELDPLVNGLKSAQPVFYADYWNARLVKDLSRRSRPEEPETPTA